MSLQVDAGLQAITQAYAGAAGDGGDLAPGAVSADELAAGGDGAVLRVMAGLAAGLGGLTAEMRAKRRADAEMWAHIHPVPINPISSGALSGGAFLLQDTDRWGPRAGFAWELRRMSAAGLTSTLNSGLNSIQALGAPVTGPGAGATVSTITLPVGVWSVASQIQLTGTPGAADANNLVLQVGGVTQQYEFIRNNSTDYAELTIQVVVTSGTKTVSVATIAAATSTAIYSAQLVATPVTAVGSVSDQVSLYKTSVAGAMSMNFLNILTAAAPTFEASSKSIVLMPGQWLQVAGAGLGATEVVCSGEAIEIELPWLPAYLK